MPIYTSYYCIHEKFSKGWTFLVQEASKHGYKSFIVDGYVNKVILVVEVHSLPSASIIVAMFNGQKVIDTRVDYPTTLSADVTNIFKPRKTEDGEQADELRIGCRRAILGVLFDSPATWEITAYLSIDVTGTLTETTSTAFTETFEGELGEVLGVFMSIMFMMMFMSMFMSILSSFREAM